MSLEEESKVIEQAFNNTRSSLEERLKQISADMEMYTAEYREANSHGDRSENAAFEQAVTALQRCNQDYGEITGKLSKVNKVQGLDSYKSIGIITIFTTVLLRRDNDGNTYTVRIFPSGVSDLDNRIISCDSRIGTAIMGKRPGDVVRVMHDTYGIEYSYTIEDIY